ncbi:hypothetical protein AUP68_09215 [Ilyonectria robusta]
MEQLLICIIPGILLFLLFVAILFPEAMYGIIVQGKSLFHNATSPVASWFSSLAGPRGIMSPSQAAGDAGERASKTLC